ncbi:MAG: hypothetical protein V4731_10000 [Pseudomonadota bacterium]
MSPLSPVRKRCVFYVSGFDPKGAAHYHALYQAEATKQSRLNGWQLDVGARKRLPGGNSAWPIHAQDGKGTEVQTHYEVMRWDDVVRKNWPMHTLALWRDLLATTLFNLRHGSLWRMFQLSWPPAVALFSPFALLVLIALLAPLATVLLGGWIVAAHELPLWTGVGASALSVAGLALTGRYLEARYSMYWLTRSYAFTARQAKGKTPDLEARLDEQALRLVERICSEQDDEVLVVGHSSGTIMAVSIAARACALLQALPHGTPRAKLSLMKLGQCIPLLALLPQAKRFRAELALLGQAAWVDWIDFSAPPDGCCFALSDPLALTDDGRGRSPKLLSPKFAEMFPLLPYQALRQDKYRMHFQYLMAHERAVDYDYFAISAGDQTLSERFAHLESVRNFTDLRGCPALRNEARQLPN